HRRHAGGVRRGAGGGEVADISKGRSGRAGQKKPRVRRETGVGMTGGKTFNVSNVVDNLPVRGVTYLVLGLCFIAMLSDGYNLGAASVAAPGILKEFAMSRAQIAPVFSAALLGMLVGALSAGYFGDRVGRKQAILLATAIICVSSFGCGLVRSFNQLMVLRFAVGVGLGALLP